MPTINSRLTAAIATIAILVPAAGAQAHTLRPAQEKRHFTISRAERHFSPPCAKRLNSEFHTDHSAW